MGGTILCDVTDSPEGRSAAECAHVLGARLGLRVVLVCVVEEVTPAARESVTGTPEFWSTSSTELSS